MSRLRVDMAACDGVGQCAFVAPELVQLDRWGYPVLRDDAAAGPAADRAARRAVRACPRRALWPAGADARGEDVAADPGPPDADTPGRAVGEAGTYAHSSWRRSPP